MNAAPIQSSAPIQVSAAPLPITNPALMQAPVDPATIHSGDWQGFQTEKSLPIAMQTMQAFSGEADKLDAQANARQQQLDFQNFLLSGLKGADQYADEVASKPETADLGKQFKSEAASMAPFIASLDPKAATETMAGVYKDWNGRLTEAQKSAAESKRIADIIAGQNARNAATNAANLAKAQKAAAAKPKPGDAARQKALLKVPALIKDYQDFIDEKTPKTVEIGNNPVTGAPILDASGNPLPSAQSFDETKTFSDLNKKDQLEYNKRMKALNDGFAAAGLTAPDLTPTAVRGKVMPLRELNRQKFPKSYMALFNHLSTVSQPSGDSSVSDIPPLDENIIPDLSGSGSTSSDSGTLPDATIQTMKSQLKPGQLEAMKAKLDAALPSDKNTPAYQKALDIYTRLGGA